jgi:hypothetical protein
MTRSALAMALCTCFSLSCGGGGATDTADGIGGDSDCAYPQATEPMALDESLAAYSWPEAMAANGDSFPLDLERVFCNADDNVDWSIFDYLLFVSVPAW